MDQVKWAAPKSRSLTGTWWLTPRGPHPHPHPGPPLAVRHRIARAARAAWALARALAWAPVDALLERRDLSSLAVLTATLLVAELCVLNSGLYGLIVNLPSLAVIWAAVLGVIRAGRDRRGLRPLGTGARRGDPAAPRRQSSTTRAFWVH
jgi:hypothetical protein